MKIGDLVKKTKGYGSELKIPMVGLIVGFRRVGNTNGVVVLSTDGIEHWVIDFVTKIS